MICWTQNERSSSSWVIRTATYPTLMAKSTQVHVPPLSLCQCTCCYDAIKGIQEVKNYYHADSLILSLPVLPVLLSAADSVARYLSICLSGRYCASTSLALLLLAQSRVTSSGCCSAYVEPSAVFVAISIFHWLFDACLTYLSETAATHNLMFDC